MMRKTSQVPLRIGIVCVLGDHRYRHGNGTLLHWGYLYLRDTMTTPRNVKNQQDNVWVLGGGWIQTWKRNTVALGYL